MQKNGFPSRLLKKHWLQLVTRGVLLLAFALRVYHLDTQSLWRDEVDAIRFSSASLLELLSVLAQKGHNGPLYFVALHSWRSLTGDTEFALRYFSVVGGMLLVALTYRVGRCLKLGQPAATIAVLLAATSPYLIWYSQEAKMYTWLVSLVLIAVCAYQAALNGAYLPGSSKTSGKIWSTALWWAVFVLATSLSFYTHILAPLMLLVYGVWAAAQWPRLKTRWRGWLISMALLTLPYLPLLLWQTSLFLAGERTGHPFYPWPEQMRLLLHFYSAGVLHAGYSVYVMAGMIFLILIGLVAPLFVSSSFCMGMFQLSWRGKTRPAAYFYSIIWPRFQLTTWLLIPSIVVYLISLRMQIFEDRYLIYIAPAFYLLAALGVVALMTRFCPAGWVILALVVIFSLRSVYRQATNPIKAEFRAAAAYIAQASEDMTTDPSASLRTDRRPPPAGEARPQYPHQVYLPFVARSPQPPVVMIHMPYLQYTFDYYFAGDYRPLEGVWTNDGRPLNEVDKVMQTRLDSVGTLWLVVSEEDYWDNRHLTRKWLAEHAELEDETHFVGVDVYRYQIP